MPFFSTTLLSQSWSLAREGSDNALLMRWRLLKQLDIPLPQIDDPNKLAESNPNPNPNPNPCPDEDEDEDENEDEPP